MEALTFYLSRIIGTPVFLNQRESMGKIQDLVVDMAFGMPKVVAAKIRSKNGSRTIDFEQLTISEAKGKYKISCRQLNEWPEPQDNTLLLFKHIMDKQIVDMDGKKVVRVNDLRLAVMPSGTYLVAVDVGIEGLLRRLSLAKPLKTVLQPFGKSVPAKLMPWEEVETVDLSHQGLRLSKAYSKLSTLHPSDLADILEDLDRKTLQAVFSSLNEEKAADVLEELEPEVQAHVLESMSLEKAADMLEKMPADKVADILDEIEKEKAELLLSKMENKASEEVRDLMEYPDNTAGSLMTTDYISLHKDMTVEQTIAALRRLKPKPDTIYYLYVLDDLGKLIANVSLRDIVIAQPETKLEQVMNCKVIHVYEYDRLDSIGDLLTKYNLLALPVTDTEKVLQGVIIIDDVIDNLLKTRKRKM